MDTISECTEAARTGNPSSTKITGFTAMEEELADAVIRICDMAAYRGMDLGGAIEAKAEYNRHRPERHRGKVY